MYVVLVDFEIKPEALENFLPLMMENAGKSLSDEPDCMVFDVCQSPDSPSKIFLYEVYASEEAFQHHLDSAHFRKFDREVADMVLKKAVRKFHRLGA